MAESWMYAASDASNLRDQPYNPSGPRADQAQAARDSSSPTEAAKSHAPRVRRRNRIINSCLECRRRKLKCDKTAPCANCTRFKRDCLYLAPALDPHSQQKLADIKEKMGALEQNLEREVVNQTSKPHMGGAQLSSASPPQDSHLHMDDQGEEDLEEDDVALEPTPLAALDNVYADDGDDELMDLGVQMGKMRISERIGGFIRPKLVDELNDTLKDVTGGRSRYSTSPQVNDHRSLYPEQPVRTLQASPKSYIGPGPEYIAPASSFFFPGTSMSTTLLDYLPSRNVADQLIAQYFLAAHYMCRAVHRPTFEAQYAVFWNQIATGGEPAPPIQAVIFAAMFTGAVSMDEIQLSRQFGTSKAALIDTLRSGTEMALAKANFLRTTKLDTMQAFIMYLIPLVRAEISRAHSALVGTAIRLAECLGLHRDGRHYTMSPIEVQVRRMLWFQLCFLDMRTCEATGPRPQIRPGDYDTQFPLNVDDVDLMEASLPADDKPYWTDMTLFRLRCECIELRRSLWFDVVQIDKKKKSLTATVVKVQRTKTALEARYLPMIDDTVPFQSLARNLLILLTQGCFIQVLHRYLFSTTTRMPDRLRQILIEAGLLQMENSIQLETRPDLAPWVWYRGAFNQYHSALLLMVEVYAYPMRKDAPRIWKCLDYIFDIPPHLSPKQKAELVITDLRDRMEVYHQMRKLRSTRELEQRVGSLSKSSVRDWTVDFNEPHAAMQVPTMPIQNPVALGQYPVLLPVEFSPPPIATADSASGPSRANSLTGAGARPEAPVDMMEDIDWNEWDRYFPVEENTGDLNIPDFDFASFTGRYTGPPLDLASFGAGGVASSQPMMNMPTSEDLADVNFTPTYFTR